MFKIKRYNIKNISIYFFLFITGAMFGSLIHYFISLPFFQHLRIIHVGDTHLSVSKKDNKLGYVGIYSLIKYLKDSEPNTPTIMIDAGDTFHGNPYSDLEKGRIAVDTWDKIRKDFGIKIYQNLGNHDFDWGIRVLKKRQILDKKIDWPIISANVLDKQNKDFFLNKKKNDEYNVYSFGKDSNKISVGIFGLMTPTLNQWGPKEVVDKITIEDPTKSAKKAVKYFTDIKQTNAIIGVGHLGYSYPGVEESATSLGVMKNNKNIDFFIDSHSHVASCIALEDKRIISNVGSHTSNIGVSKLTFMNGKLISVSDKFINLSDLLNLTNLGVITGDKKTDEFAKYIKKELIRLKKLADSKIILNNSKKKYVSKYDIDNIKNYRTDETKMENFTTRIIRQHMGTDIALIHNSVIKEGIKKGILFYGSLLNCWDITQFLYKYTLSGKVIKELLFVSLKTASADIVFAIDGLDITWDPQTKKIVNVVFTGTNKELEDEKLYTVATSLFKDSIPLSTDFYFESIKDLDKKLEKMDDNSRSYSYEYIIKYLNDNDYNLDYHSELHKHIIISTDN